jgi:hypothetical protein
VKRAGGRRLKRCDVNAINLARNGLKMVFAHRCAAQRNACADCAKRAESNAAHSRCFTTRISALYSARIIGGTEICALNSKGSTVEIDRTR